MGHPDIENRTPFAIGANFATDEEGNPLFVPIVKATYALDSRGELSIAEKQTPVDFAGKWWGEPGNSSWRYEPESAFMKPATDVVLLGHARTSRGSQTEVLVRVQVGPVEKTVRVTGNRYWIRSSGVYSLTRPESFEEMPLLFERAFGGWDRTPADPERHECEMRNPVGVGFHSKHGRFEDGLRAPNLEDPRDPVRDYGVPVAPAGFGFTSPEWQPRASYGGTYDASWSERRMPLLPVDFDRRFFNAAASGMIAPGYLGGGEWVNIENVSRRGVLSFRLPVVPSPECRVQLASRRDAQITTALDTVILDMDNDSVMLVWRGHLAVRGGPHDILSLQISAEGVSAPAAIG